MSEPIKRPVRLKSKHADRLIKALKAHGIHGRESSKPDGFKQVTIHQNDDNRDKVNEIIKYIRATIR